MVRSSPKILRSGNAGIVAYVISPQCRGRKFRSAQPSAGEWMKVITKRPSKERSL